MDAQSAAEVSTVKDFEFNFYSPEDASYHEDEKMAPLNATSMPLPTMDLGKQTIPLADPEVPPESHQWSNRDRLQRNHD